MTGVEIPDQTQILRLRWHAAFARLQLKAARLTLAFKAGFDPNQPRVPAGNPDGGQWTRVGGSGEGQILSGANPDVFVKPGTRLAQAQPPKPKKPELKVPVASPAERRTGPIEPPQSRRKAIRYITSSNEHPLPRMASRDL